jgi:hypothetical protein
VIVDGRIEVGERIVRVCEAQISRASATSTTTTRSTRAAYAHAVRGRAGHVRCSV